jgi:hypothetical protein
MSDLYTCKVLQDKTVTLSAAEIVDLFPVTYDWSEEFLLENMNGIASFDDLYSEVGDLIKKEGSDKITDKFHDCSFFSSSRYKDMAALLKGDLAKSFTPKDSYTLEGFYLGNNLLAQLLPDQFSPVPLKQLTIEVVTVHPDAGFNSSNKPFTVRLLKDLETPSHSLFYKWFEKQKKGSIYDESFGGLEESVYAMIAGSKRVSLTDMHVSDKNFWKENKSKWWYKELHGYLTEDSDSNPYQIATFLIHVHPSWMPQNHEGKLFTSAAY